MLDGYGVFRVTIMMQKQHLFKFLISLLAGVFCCNIRDLSINQSLLLFFLAFLIC